MEFRKHTLANGLEIVAEVNDAAHSAGYGFFVRTGSRDEDDSIWGVSHFLEHMAFKGTPSRTAEDVNRRFDELGAHYNAFTSDENTVYYAAVLPECQDECIELLADIMRPSLRQDDFDTEKQVIIEEILMYDDQPPFGADDKCKAIFFKDHALARNILGTVDSITRLTSDQMRSYFDRRYSPANVVLAAAGKVNWEALVALAEKLCGNWKPAEGGRKAIPPQYGTGFHLIHRPKSAQQYFMQMTPGPAATDNARFAAKVMAMIVGDDSGSRLYWELIDQGLAENASLGHYEYDNAGVCIAYLACDPEAAEENIEVMRAVLADVEVNGVNEDELAQAKSKLKSRIVLGSERPRNRLFVVGGNWTHRREYRSINDDLDAVNAVSIADIAALLKKYPLSEGVAITVGPLEAMEGATPLA